MPRNPNKSYINVPLTHDERSQVELLALKEDRSIGNMAVVLIREALEHRGVVSPQNQNQENIKE